MATTSIPARDREDRTIIKALRIIDARALALSGALAIYAGKAGFTIVAARDIAGRRLWNTPARRKRPVKTADARGN